MRHSQLGGWEKTRVSGSLLRCVGACKLCRLRKAKDPEPQSDLGIKTMSKITISRIIMTTIFFIVMMVVKSCTSTAHVNSLLNDVGACSFDFMLPSHMLFACQLSL